MKHWSLCWAFALLLLQACAMPQHRVASDTIRGGPSTLIYVARRGWHVDVGFRALDLTPPLAAVAADFPHAQYLFFGFGDRRYLVSRHKNVPNLLAALWPGAAMVLATGLDAAPEEAFGAKNVTRLRVTVMQAQAAQQFIWDSLVKANAVLRFYEEGPYAGSLYYSAVPRYSAVHTCNTWIAEALKAADLPVHSRGVVFAAQLWSQLRSIAAPDGAARSTAIASPSGAPIAKESWPYSATTSFGLPLS
jgi:hypothetical protein